MLWFLVVPSLLLASCQGKTAQQWKSRIIYQLLVDRFSHSESNPTSSCQDLRKYCGGTFKGIEKNLDYIQGLDIIEDNSLLEKTSKAQDMKGVRVIVLLLLCAYVCSDCPDGFLPHMDSCYALIRSKASWAEAAVYCQAVGANLATIETQVEQDFLVNWLLREYSTIPAFGVWVAGANAIWISPVVENTINGYHGYWAKNLYEVNPHFGTKDELKSLISECHTRDIWVMVDIVANHMGRTPGCVDRDCPPDQLTNYTSFVPFNQTEHFHQLCYIQDWRNQTQVELCRLGILSDLNQTVPYVRETLLSWISNLVSEYDIDGLRVDTLCEVEKPFWREFEKAAGVFCLGEANNGDRPAYLAAYQGEAMESVLNFPMYWALRRAFNEKQDMKLLKDNLDVQRQLFEDVTVLGLFIDNHDFQRFLNITPDDTLLRNALVYIFFGQGIPIVYYGTEQKFNGGNDPNQRESLWPHFANQSDMYQFITRLSDNRKSSGVDMGQLNQREVYVDEDTLIFTRGDKQQLLVAVSNLGQSDVTQRKRIAILTQVDDGTEYVNTWDSSDVITVRDGVLDMSLVNGEAKVYLSKAQTSLATNIVLQPNRLVLYILMLYCLLTLKWLMIEL